MNPTARLRKVEYVRPWLYPQQSAAIFDPARYSLIEASTKSGKTVSAMVWLVEQAMAGGPGRNFWWASPTYPQAKVVYRRLKRSLPRRLYTSNETELTITLVNGSVIWFKGSEKSDTLYSEDVYAAVIDEASRVREASWHAVRTTLTATQGPVRIIGNVKGRKNWFYRLARRAEAGEPNMAYHRITARDAVAAGVLADEEVRDAASVLPANVYRELYEAEASDDEGNPFGIEAIRACVAPLSGGPPAAFGWDLGKSQDWTVGIGLERDGSACRFERWRRPWSETISGIRQANGLAPAQVDSTGVGDPILEELQRGSSAENYSGYVFTGPSKQRLMEGLAVAIQQQRITYPDGVTALELESFEYQYTRTGVRYAAPDGEHDDTVCALALVVHQLSHLPRRYGVLALPRSAEGGWSG